MKRETVNGADLETWTPAEVSEALEKGEIVLIDVRTPQEFAFERVPGALLSPMQEFDPARLPTQDGKRLVLHCGSGARSRRMAEKIIGAGAERIAHMEGGFGAWKQAGLDYITTDMASGAPKRTRSDG